MYYPTLDEVRQLKKYGNLVPVYYEMMADLETPVSAYLKIARGSPYWKHSELFFEKKRLIPALQRLLISYWRPALIDNG